MTTERRRYDQYPEMARLVRSFGTAERAAVHQWFTAVFQGFEGFVRSYPTEADRLGFTPEERMAANVALQSWFRVMTDLMDILLTPRSGDWCCKQGMMASPSRCPQHGFEAGRSYELGTIIERAYGEGKERAVCVVDRSDNPCPWVSVEFPFRYSASDIAKGSWMVVGHA